MEVIEWCSTFPTLNIVHLEAFAEDYVIEEKTIFVEI